MLTLLLGTDALISGWITAHLLAIFVAYFFLETRQFDSIVQLIGKIFSNRVYHQNHKRITFLGIVVFLGGVLTLIMRLEPVEGGLVFYLVNNSESQWNKYYFILDDLLIAFVILLLTSFVPVLNSIFDKAVLTIQDWKQTRFRVIRIQNLDILTPSQLSHLLLLFTSFVRYSLILFVSLLCLALIFSLYPQTHGLAQAFLDKVIEGLVTFWAALIEVVPNIITLVAITLVTRMALKILRFFYIGMRRGKVYFPSIHPELVEPTYQLLRFLIIAFALVAAFPYIPGSSSPVFQGLSIFVGFLLSLGSTSLVSNLVAGIVLIYTRGLKIGDRVEIAGTVGDVVDRTLLVTRVKTIKNVVVTIPNNMVLQNQIVNYSADAEENGLILNTSVTIGYDVPWRLVQKLLINAARETKHVLGIPEPFVFKTSLDDYYISYELNAYTNSPLKMATIYSELHQNILDQFSQAGVEILSPAYMALRNGQDSTISPH